MPVDLQSRAQFLALAEFCQGVIESLSDYLDGGPVPTPILQDAINALASVKSGDPLKFGQKPAHALGSYEQVRTLEECWKGPQLAEAAGLLAALLSDDRTARSSAQRVIELFSKLQSRALWSFEQPRQTAPPDFRELCRTLQQS